MKKLEVELIPINGRGSGALGSLVCVFLQEQAERSAASCSAAAAALSCFAGARDPGGSQEPDAAAVRGHGRGPRYHQGAACSGCLFCAGMTENTIGVNNRF